jgi:hypothetical protein
MSEYVERVRRLQETAEALRRTHPANHPSEEDIAWLHEVHAKHEAALGHTDAAAAARLRAQRARARAAR